MEKLKNIFSFIWKYRTTILLVLCIILAILFLKECRGRNSDEIKNNQNITALTENIKIKELKNGQLLAEKALFIGKEKDLKKLNENLYSEIKDLKKNGVKPLIIVKPEYIYVDSGSVANHIQHINGDLYSTNFDYKSTDGIISIKGKSRFYINTFVDSFFLNGKESLKLKIRQDTTFFDNITFKSGLILGIEQGSDGIQRIFAKPNPYTDKIKITNIDAVVLDEFYKNKYAKSLDKKEKRVTIGPYVGYGLSIESGGIIKISPQFGIGIGYSLVRF